MGPRVRPPIRALSCVAAGLFFVFGHVSELPAQFPARLPAQAAPHAEGELKSFPWRPPDRVPVAEQIVSVEFPEHDEPLYESPDVRQADANHRRRGAAQLGARLPLYAVQPPNGLCHNNWLMVGPRAWVCEDRVRLSNWPPLEANQHTTFESGLPYSYHFVGTDGAFGYENLALAEEGIPDSQLEPGFAVGIRRTQRKAGGDLYSLTTHGLWIPARDLRPAKTITFQGAHLQGSLDHGFTHREAEVWQAPGKRRAWKQRTTVPRLTHFQVRQRERKRGQDFVRTETDQWLRASDVRLLSPTEPPEGLKPQQRWFDIDTTEQVLVAYEGTTPVFATLVSTGRGRGKSPLATPKGTFRVWVKLLSTDMTNLEDQSASRYWAIEDVPYVMFFKDGYGLHGAFWHDSFGNRRSHGCVNLAPRDAQFLFQWAGPRLPAGWHAVLPNETNPGTLVVVR